MQNEPRIFIAGSETLIGGAIVRGLQREGYNNPLGPSEGEVDLTKESDVDRFFAENRPDWVFYAAGKSGGIGANEKYPAELMRDNILSACHVLGSAHRCRVKKLLYLASSCCYPRNCPQPMRVESLLTGPLEPTNEAYATAKIAGIQLCNAYRRQYGVNFISAIPANAFGPGDDFSLEDSHVIAALIRKIHEAKSTGAESVEIWGTGAPRREFIFADDLGSACLFVMLKYEGMQPINLGVDADLSIKELADLIKDVVGYRGHLRFNSSKPDGMPAKLLDSAPLRSMGWEAKTTFREGLEATYQWFLRSETAKGPGHVRAAL